MMNDGDLADFTSPVVVEGGALVRPGEVLVDLAAEGELADRLTEKSATGHPFERADKGNFRNNLAGPAYGDLNARLAPAGIRLWVDLPATLPAELARDIRGVTLNHVLVGETGGGAQPNDFYHGGPGGPPQQVPGPPAGTALETGPGPGRVDVIVLDNGLPVNWDQLHQNLSQHLKRVKDLVLPADTSVLDEDSDGVRDTQAGHGLFISALIARLAPELRLELRRVLHASGEGDESLIVATLEEVAGSTARVVNLSFGTYTADDIAPERLVAAVRRVTDGGRVVVAAAGNAGDKAEFASRPFWPAALPGVIAVGAYREPSDGAWAKSNGADVYAPGVDVVSEFVRWPEDSGTEFDGFARWSGTSFAAPVVAARIAQLTVSENGFTDWWNSLDQPVADPPWPGTPRPGGTAPTERPRVYVPVDESGRPVDLTSWPAVMPRSS